MPREVASAAEEARPGVVRVHVHLRRLTLQRRDGVQTPPGAVPEGYKELSSIS